MRIESALIVLVVVAVIVWRAVQPASPSPEPVLPALVPAPTTMQTGEGTWSPDAKTVIAWSGTEAGTEARKLAVWLGERIGRDVDVVRADPGQEKANRIVVEAGGDPDSEAYSLFVDEQGILLQGGAAGLFYGIQTLKQLAPLDGEAAFPFVFIEDQPAFAWRGMLLDACRHFMEPEFVKRYIDLLAFHKMNVLHWHLTEDQGWRIAIEAYPRLTEVGAWRTEKDGSRYGGFYTREQIREIVAYAAERHVTVVPEIEMPGHSQAALAAYPELSCTGGPHTVWNDWGVSREIYCAGNEATFRFLDGVLDEVLEMFPSRYIHLGGDEAPVSRWEACAKCRRRVADLGLHDAHDLHAWFLGRIADSLAGAGRTIIGWDEILDGPLPDDAVVQAWRSMDKAAEALEAGAAGDRVADLACLLRLRRGRDRPGARARVRSRPGRLRTRPRPRRRVQHVERTGAATTRRFKGLPADTGHGRGAVERTGSPVVRDFLRRRAAALRSS